MGNYISSKHASEEMLDISNGGMSVLVCVLVLAGTELAKSEWEQRFVSWIARRDQAVFGLGMVGFDLAQIPWTGDWQTEKAFFLRVVDLAHTGFRFEDLGYYAPFVKGNLTTLRALVASVTADVTTAEQHAFEDASEPVPRCDLHDVYAHAFGCALCGDDIPPRENRTK